MVRRRPLTRIDERGIGGFFEAILAVMIVTSGFTILLVSINLVQGDHDSGDRGSSQNKVYEICRKLLADKRLFRPPYVLLLSNSFLWSEILEEEMSDFDDYSVSLIVCMESPRPIVLAQKGFSTTPREIINIRVPVDVQMTPATIHAGILELRVGA